MTGHSMGLWLSPLHAPESPVAQAQTWLPQQPMATTSLIGQGSACHASTIVQRPPTTAEALRAVRFTEAKAPATVLAAISPFIAVKPRLTATSPATPCQSKVVTTAKTRPVRAAPSVPTVSSRAPPEARHCHSRASANLSRRNKASDLPCDITRLPSLARPAPEGLRRATLLRV